MHLENIYFCYIEDIEAFHIIEQDMNSMCRQEGVQR